MSNIENIVSIHRTHRDYCGDREAAKDLVDKIQAYWHKRGHTSVKVWLEPVDLANGKKRWDIRGNIVFNCNSLYN